MELLQKHCKLPLLKGPSSPKHRHQVLDFLVHTPKTVSGVHTVCAKTKKHKLTGWNGWIQHSITGYKAHFRKHCPFEKRNKQKNKNASSNTAATKENNSLAAQVAQLTSLVTALSQKM
jgi:hypothetical protein